MAFQAGKLIFHRQWPYQYNLANGDEGTKVKGKFAVAPLPGPRRSRCLQPRWPQPGHLDVLRAQEAALDFIKFYTSEEHQKANLELASQAPTFTDAVRRQGAAGQVPVPDRPCATRSTTRSRVRAWFATATPRRPIQDAAYAALTGTKSSADALKGLQSQLDEITGK